MAGKERVFKYSIQDSDTQFAREYTPHGAVGFAFNRSHDSFVHKTDGQDYFVFSDSNDKFSFVLCDGVGQSYCGQLAAKFLGDWLFQWLEDLNIEAIHNSDIAIQLTNELNNLSAEAQQMVSDHKLPESLPELLLIALNEQKNYGSEAVFVVGRIDFKSKCSPPLLSLFWLGDTQFHIFDKKGGEVEIPGKWVNAERWSTKNGIRGTDHVNHWSYRLRKEKMLVAHSDGIKSPVNDHLFELVDRPNEMIKAIDGLRSSPESDDVSMICFEFIRKPFSFLSCFFSILGIS